MNTDLTILVVILTVTTNNTVTMNLNQAFREIGVSCLTSLRRFSSGDSGVSLERMRKLFDTGRA